MTSLTFSITIPLGPKPSEWLGWTLQSLAAQKVETRLAICSVNAGKELKDQLQPYANQIKYERFGPDEGQSDAINEGWKAVDADIYGWLNDDDCLAPGALDKVAEIFSNHPEVNIVFGDTVLFENGGYTRLHPGPREIGSVLFRDNLISQPSCFVRKNALFEIGLLDSHRHYTMDWDLWVRLYNAGNKFYYLSETLSLVRHHSDTKTGSLNFQRLSEIFKLVLKDAGLKKALHTGFNFSIFHLAEYGPFKRFFAIVKRALCEPKVITRNDERCFKLFHYNGIPTEKLVVDFDSSVDCQVILDDKIVFRGKTDRFEKRVDLEPKETLSLRLNFIDLEQNIGQKITLK